MKKILLVSGVVASAVIVSACQSTTPVQSAKSERMMKHKNERMYKGHPHAMRHAMAKTCEGKAAGDTVQAALGKRTLQGQCEMVFMPKRDQNLKSNYKMSQPLTRSQDPLTDAKRAEMVKQFDLRLAQKQALQTACQGQTVGQNIELKFAEKNIQGQCVLKFKPQRAA